MTLFDWMQVAGFGVGFIVWLIRLEGKVTYIEKNHDEFKATVKAEHRVMNAKHDQLDSKIFDELSQIKQSLARLEGRLGVDNE